MSTATTPSGLAGELLSAYADHRLVAPPSTREGSLDLPSAYAVEAEIVRRRGAEGHRTVGVKVGFANKAAWRLLKLDTLAWAHMYSDTVRHAANDRAVLDLSPLVSPKIEPEIVLSLARPVPVGADAEAVLAAVEWIALGFEIIDCVFPGWTFQPADFVASKGLHAALIVGTPLPVTEAQRAGLAASLASFTVALERNGAVVAEGAGRNALRSPALCLGELAAARAKAGAEALGAGSLVSSGTLTESQPIASAETWTARVNGLPLPPLTLALTGQPAPSRAS